VLTDPLLTLAEMTIDPVLCGPNNENVRLDYDAQFTDDMKDCVFGDFNSSYFFRDTQDTIRNKWGKHVKILPVLFKYDKTLLTRTESKSGWPIFIQGLCFTTEVLVTAKGIEVVGFVPELLQGDEVLKAILQDLGIELHYKLEEACKMTRKWLEQDFLDRLWESIRRCNEEGPVFWQFNQGDAAFVEEVMPVFAGLQCKYSE